MNITLKEVAEKLNTSEETLKSIANSIEQTILAESYVSINKIMTVPKEQIPAFVKALKSMTQ